MKYLRHSGPAAPVPVPIKRNQIAPIEVEWKQALLAILAVPVFGLGAHPALSETLAVPCVNGGGSSGWMYNSLPKHYFPLGLIAVNETPIRNVKNHPDFNPNYPWQKYATCVIVPAKYP